ncbi:MAG: glycosyltransferase family 4 protein [Gemmatimonadota bacterium]|nr:glycosyltransferase family 4 protein [Gemmatimonadota bacterium]
MTAPSGGLHILLIHQLFVTHGQAGGTRHFELARRWVAAGHRVSVVTGRRSYLSGAVHDVDEALPVGLEVVRVGTLPFAGGGFLARIANFVSFMVLALWTALRIPDVDVVVGTTPPLFQALAAAVGARLRGVPFVLEVRDLWPDFAIELGVLRSRPLIGLSRALERGLYRAADRVVVNSPGFVEHVRARGASAVAVVPNGVETDDFDPDAHGTAFRERHRFAPSDTLVLYAGAHGPPNDLGVVLDAADRTRDRPDLHWVLVGDGRDKARLVEQAGRRGLERVRFLPPIPKADMPEVLAAADVGLAILAPLALFRTVYPNKVFDYMAAGRPVLLAIDGVIRQVVEDGGAGRWVRAGDPDALARAALAYADDPDRGRAEGRRGRQWVERHFQRAAQADRFLEALAKVTGSADPDPFR